jgi:hypothetical protein
LQVEEVKVKIANQVEISAFNVLALAGEIFNQSGLEAIESLASAFSHAPHRG